MVLTSPPADSNAQVWEFGVKPRDQKLKQKKVVSRKNSFLNSISHGFASWPPCWMLVLISAYQWKCSNTVFKYTMAGNLHPIILSDFFWPLSIELSYLEKEFHAKTAMNPAPRENLKWQYLTLMLMLLRLGLWNVWMFSMKKTDLQQWGLYTRLQTSWSTANFLSEWG